MRREIGIINVGGSGRSPLMVKIINLDYKEAYVTLEKKNVDVVFSSDSPETPAKCYLTLPLHIKVYSN